MLTFELLRDKGILVVQPSAPLQAEDFQSLTATVDPYVTERGQLAGLLIEAPSFPGWDHRSITRVAAVTDSGFLKVMPRIAEHFAHPEIRVFDGSERARALAWLEGKVPGT